VAHRSTGGQRLLSDDEFARQAGELAVELGRAPSEVLAEATGYPGDPGAGSDGGSQQMAHNSLGPSALPEVPAPSDAGSTSEEG
jgi:hypothetical protein